MLVERFFGLSDLFLIDDVALDPLAKLIKFLFHKDNCTGDVLLHSEPCHFLSQVVLDHRLDEIIEHTFEGFLESPLHLLFKEIGVEANKRFEAF